MARRSVVWRGEWGAERCTPQRLPQPDRSAPPSTGSDGTRVGSALVIDMDPQENSMGADSRHEALSREDAHPRAREALPDFFWDAADPCSPFGDDTGLDVLEALRDSREEELQGSPIELLDALLARWEVANEHWDTVDADAVQALGAEDEFSLLTRDEAILGLAFAQIFVEGRIDAEVRRRAMLALTRQALPALLHGWGDRALQRAERLDRMRETLLRRWD
jgi:uncharacterized protein YfeS